MPVELNAPPDERPDVEFLTNGKVKLNFDGTVITLRRPKLGEFKKLRELLYEVQDESGAALLERVREAATPEVEDYGVGAVALPILTQADQVEKSLTQAKQVREDTSRAESAYLVWLRDAIATLGDKPLDLGEDEMPLWATSTELVTSLQRHWRTIPLPSGVR